MKQRKVEEIVLPFKEGIPLHPSVRIGDKIIRAIELMVRNDLKCIAVIRKDRPVGMVCLDDAFQRVGLKGRTEKEN